MKKETVFLLLALAAAGLYFASQKKAPAQSTPKRKAPEDNGDENAVTAELPGGSITAPVQEMEKAAEVETPQGERVTVSFPAAATLQRAADEALEAAELADSNVVQIRPQAQGTQPSAQTTAAASSRPVVSNAKAQAIAPGLATNIRTKKYNYSRQLLKDFQSATGLVVDGIYGPASASMLGNYTNAPPALFVKKTAK